MDVRTLEIAPKIEDCEDGFWLPEQHFYVLENDAKMEQTQELLEVKSEAKQANYLLTYYEQSGEFIFDFFSKCKNIRALELMDFLLPEFGLAKGSGEYANGKLSSSILNVWVQEEGCGSVAEYLKKRITGYYTDTQWIEAVSYSQENKEQLEQLTIYQKKRIAWAYVETTQLAKEGELIFIRSLENESGIYIEAKEENYLMIGCRGEIYNISKEKFQSTYEPTEELLDVFENMLDYMPEIRLEANQSYCSLDLIAKICYPKPGAGIYAKKLQKRTKIFYRGGEGEYHIGRPKDYLAIRQDDLADMYIIRQDIFLRTYEQRV